MPDPEAEKKARRLLLQRLRQKKYREANLEKVRERDKKRAREYHKLNPEKKREYRTANREKISEQKKKWCLLNADRNRETKRVYQQKKLASDPSFRLTRNIRSSVQRVLRKKHSSKTKHTHEYLGCSLAFFTTEYWPSKIRGWNNAYPEHKLDLESNDIAIDHVKPIRAFEENEIHECWHYTNLQPLPAAINSRKSDTWSEADESFWRSNILHNADYTNPYLPVDMGNI